MEGREAQERMVELLQNSSLTNPDTTRNEIMDVNRQLHELESRMSREHAQDKEAREQMLELLQNSGILNRDTTLQEIMEVARQFNQTFPEEYARQSFIVWPTFSNWFLPERE